MRTEDILPFGGVLAQGAHRLPVRVYYADTDFSGVVYHGRYLEFFERGRTEFLRLCDVHHHELAGEAMAENFAWVVRRLEIDYVKPARIDDMLVVETRVAAVSGARITMKQTIMRQDCLLAGAQVEAALVNGQGRPCRFPSAWLACFHACGIS